MADVILILGLGWWFAGTFFGTLSRLRNAGGSTSLLGSAAPPALYGTGLAAVVSMLVLARTARLQMAAADGDFGLFVFGAVLCAVLAGCTLGAARA